MIRHDLWLGALTLLFALCVTAQALQRVFELEVLPTFEAWHGGLLPYWLLLTAQIALLGVMVRTVVLVAADRVAATRGKAVVLLTIGSLYLATMSFRFLAGQTILEENTWFAAWLPALFHIDLALFVVLLGHYHAVKAARAAGAPAQ